MNFSERLRRAREHADLTQEALAQRSGVKQGTISKIERGESESSTFVVQLAVACGVRCEWLALEIGEMLESALKPDEEALLGKYRASDDVGKTAIQRVAESLASYTVSSADGQDKAA
jgi:transcriptional regulator with XRE-family HTH domain